jgi:hypothetical protein
METQDRNLVNSALHGGNPVRSYIKTVPSRVYVTLWNTFENIPQGIILEGNPRAADETSIVDVWSADEDYYFKNKNKKHFETGVLIPYTRTTEARERTVEEYSDAELTTIINSKFFTLQNVLNSTSAVATLFRIKNLAMEAEKSDKIIKAIEARISEVQAEEYKPLSKVVNMEL